MIIIVYGPPGSGKGTQAQSLADYFGLFHFDTGRIIEQVVHNPDLQNDPVIKKERELFDSGVLNTPEWVATNIVEKKIKELGKLGKGIVFSGSPRTLPEAEKIIPLLIDLYGKDKIYVIRLIIKPETSIFRNSNRKVCKDCGRPLIFSKDNVDLKNCAVCGGQLVTRTLDIPETIKVRIEEYKNRTEPICEFLEKNGIKVINIDGEPIPETITKEILSKIPK